ncbi:hypothetical protein [Acinetobacter sp. 2JN-4]|uniref:hypothetical protein n=1 Tax=Acinetobacter sp. 2JN-4 TaxID=2479844 RepID=UPI001D1953DF|nr:hypothetical protein [Acinetobacter sp. 2JN-4]
MKTQGYIYLNSDQVYGDYIDYFYNEQNIKCMSIMLRVKIGNLFYSCSLLFKDFSSWILEELIHCEANFLSYDGELNLFKNYDLYNLKSEQIGFIYFNENL